MSRSVIIIGAGFAGLSSAAFMAKAGWEVTVIEKNATAGGRAQQLVAEGFTYDMGPSWYWMPDVFERFFNQFGKRFLTTTLLFVSIHLTGFIGKKVIQTYQRTMKS